MEQVQACSLCFCFLAFWEMQCLKVRAGRSKRELKQHPKSDQRVFIQSSSHLSESHNRLSRLPECSSAAQWETTTHTHTQLSWSHPRYLLPAVAEWLMTVCTQWHHPSFKLFLKLPSFVYSGSNKQVNTYRLHHPLLAFPSSSLLCAPEIHLLSLPFTPSSHFYFPAPSFLRTCTSQVGDLQAARCPGALWVL